MAEHGHVTDEAALLHEIRDLLVSINDRLGQRPAAVIQVSKDLTAADVERIRSELQQQAIFSRPS